MYFMKEKSLTTKDIAEYCQVTQRTVVQWINEGKLKFFRTPGKHIRVYRNNFVEFLREYGMPIPEELAGAVNINGKKRILIVDDDKEMVGSIVRLLKREDKYELEMAYDGFEAGQKFISQKPDLVILDIRMPRVDGYKLCAAIRNSPENKNVKIFIISGFIGQRDKDMLFELGVDDYLEKPFDNQELKLRVANLFGWNRRAEDK